MGSSLVIYMRYKGTPCAYTRAVCFQAQQPAGVAGLIAETVKYEVTQAVDDGFALVLLHILGHVGVPTHYDIGTGINHEPSQLSLAWAC